MKVTHDIYVRMTYLGLYIILRMKCNNGNKFTEIQTQIGDILSTDSLLNSSST